MQFPDKVSLLDRMQGFFRTDIRYLVKNTAWMSFAQGTAAIGGLLLTVAYANLLPQEMYGSLRYLLAATSVLTLTTLPGVSTIVTRAISRGNNYYASGVKLRMQASVFGSALALLGAGYYFAAGAAPWLIAGYIAIALALPLTEVYTTILAVFEGQKRFHMRALTGIADTLVPLVAILGTLMYTDSVVTILCAFFVSHALVRVSTHLLFRPKEESRTLPHTERRDAVTLTIFQALSTASIHLDKILLFTLLGPAPVAAFAVANSFPERLRDFPRIFGTLAFPKFSAQPPQPTIEAMPRKILLLGFGILILATSYAILAPWLFGYLFPAYEDAVLPSQVLAFTLVYAATYPLGALFTAHNYMRALYGIAIFSSLTGIVAMAWLIPLLGFWGAVYGTIATRAAHITASWYFFIMFRRSMRTRS